MHSFLRKTICLFVPVLFCAVAHAQPVLTYHHDAARSGNYVVPELDWERARGLHFDSGFAARFAGHLYAQPLYWQPPGAAQGLLVVASEDNTVAAIDARSGRTVWSRSLAPPVPLSAFGCGNIDPLGISGTPVIDAATGTLYLDAMTAAAPGPRHLAYALSLKDGATLPGWPVDVEAALAEKGLRFNAADQNERGALAILGGRVFIPYGGHFGDCGDYHGWIVGIGLADPHDIAAWRTRADKGGVWAPGGIAVADGRLVFATGNTLGARRWGGGEAVFRLGPDLAGSDHPQNYFAAADWRALDVADLDIGGTAPVPLDAPSSAGVERLVLALGKDARAYLLDRDDLGGVGGELMVATVAEEPIRTAPATWTAGAEARVAFTAPGAHCPDARSGDALTVLAIRAGRPPGLVTAWCGAFRGHGAPIVTTTDGHANPIVWVTGAQGDDLLHGFRGDTGEELYSGPRRPLAGLRHFGTLLAVGNRLYVGADGRIYAFSF